MATAILLAASTASTACANAHNYGAIEPRYTGSFSEQKTSITPERLLIGTFNIAFAQRIDSAIAVLRGPELRDADILLLQEMDAPGTERIARALAMDYVYYPATRHPKNGRDFGNAVLSRWPIVADRKILLPHIAVIGATRRSATAATIKAGDELVRVYSAHLGTVVNVTPQQRREQLQAIIDDAARFEKVILGGDMNDHVAGSVAIENGYTWPTRHGPWTGKVLRLDHVFLKGLGPARINGSGTVSENRGASDHLAVWVIAELR